MAAQEEIDGLLFRLSDVPLRIAHAVEGYNESSLHETTSEGEWSAADIFAHIRASDAIVAYRVYALLTRDNPTLPAYDERRWAEVARYAQADFRSSLALYALHRAELVNMLRHTNLDNWQCVGLHEARGPVSLLDIVTSLVEHEEEHCT
ncbi:MAG: DinB family protein, partial [Ktedonobacteraceae bacterium]